MIFDRIWYHKHPLSYVLMPAAWVYAGVVSARRWLYQRRYFSSERVSVPVIIVGNLTVGGTGKTPFVQWLAGHLRELGFKPGLISRGYGGQGPFPRSVTVDSDPKHVGDEPALLARSTGCPMIVAPDRIAAAKQLLATHDVDIIIADDGLQHYRLQRDLEILIVDSERQFGNQQCLPAGPLREPLSRKNTVDFIVINGDLEQDGFLLKQSDAVSLADPLLKRPLGSFNKVHAVAGIGNPARFFEALKTQGIEVIPHSFPDHYYYSESDLMFGDDLPVLMTEKDAVKCRNFCNALHFSVPVSVEISKTLKEKLDQKLVAHK